jgi:cyanate lyase
MKDLRRQTPDFSDDWRLTTANLFFLRRSHMKKSDAPEALLAAAGMERPMKRTDVTEMVVMQRLKKGLSWAKIAKTVGSSKEWTTAALLGQMQMTKEQAEAAGKLLGLPEYAVLLLQQVPYKGSLPTAVPTDPLIYRFYELVNVYGTTFKELIHEEFGDGIMSAIDFKMDLTREPDPKGDRVKIVMSGKYLQYKTY